MAQRKAIEHRLTNTTAWLIVVVSLLAGVILTVISSSYPDEWFGPPAQGLGATAISIGTVSILYELFLRRQVQDELFRMVDLERDLAATQLVGGGQFSGTDWAAFLQGATEIRAIMTEPTAWITQNWNRLEARLSEQPSSLQLFIPDPEAAYVHQIAQKLGVDEERYRALLTDALENVEDRWKKAKQDSKLKVGSSIEIRLLPHAPSYSLFLAGSQCVLAVGRALKRIGREDDYTVLFSGSLKEYPLRWIIEQFDDAMSGNIRFTDRADS